MANKQLRMLTLMFTVFVLGSILLAACVRPGSPTTTTGSGGGGSTPTTGSSGGGSCPTGTSVMTGGNVFQQTCITLKKGAMLSFVPGPGSTYHNLDYGQWNGSTPQTTTYKSAPKVSNLLVQTQSVSVGPFTTAGTYHIYCTVHPQMNLTVIVK